MAKKSLIWYIRQLRRPVFTTHELSALSGKSASSITQRLNFLEKEGVIFKVCRGIWAEAGTEKLSPYLIIPFLLPRHRAYISFISALHLHGLVEQIPQVITLATTAHTKTIHTRMGTYCFHQIAPRFFDGFSWYKERCDFLIAEPEKALIDSLYLSTRRKKRFGHFPELDLPRSFSRKRAKKWIKKIPDNRIRTSVEKKLEKLLRDAAKQAK